MRNIPLDLQRRLEKRWAARFSRPPKSPQNDRFHAAPPHFVLSAGDDPYLRRPARPYAPWPRSVAAEAEERLDGPAGRGVIRLA